MPTVEFLPVATAPLANVDTQVNFVGSGYQTVGFQAGIAIAKQLNKVWRQASMVAACIANFISQQLGINVLDDGNLANLTANFTSAVKAASVGAAGIVTVPFSANPVFDASLGIKFGITLTGNVVGATLINFLDGMILTFVVHQDATGGRTFAWPGSVPGAIIDPGVSATSIQAFIVDELGVIRPYTPMTVS